MQKDGFSPNDILNVIYTMMEDHLYRKFGY
jgi:hypothetical protein